MLSVACLTPSATEHTAGINGYKEDLYGLQSTVLLPFKLSQSDWS